MARTWKPGKGQWALEIDGLEEPVKKRRPRVYIYEDATADGCFILRTPDFEAVNEVMRDLSMFGYWSRIYNGLIIKARHLKDLVAACHAHGWYVRVQQYATA